MQEPHYLLAVHWRPPNNEPDTVLTRFLNAHSSMLTFLEPLPSRSLRTQEAEELSRLEG